MTLVQIMTNYKVGTKFQHNLTTRQLVGGGVTWYLVFWMEPTRKVSPCWAQHRTAPTHSPAPSPLLKAPSGKGLPRVEQEGGQ